MRRNAQRVSELRADIINEIKDLMKSKQLEQIEFKNLFTVQVDVTNYDAVYVLGIENVIVTFLSDDGYVIDTEGSELAILSALDFKRWSFKVICCEHAYTEARGPLHELLSANGYERVHEEISQYDDWYVRRDILRTKGGASA